MYMQKYSLLLPTVQSQPTHTYDTQSGYRFQLKEPSSGLWQKTMKVKLHTVDKRKNSPFYNYVYKMYINI